MPSLLTAFLCAWSAAALAQFCKPVPESPDWPCPSKWQMLNDTVQGRLFQPVPPGAVCHPELGIFNNASCAVVQDQWSNSTFHALDPITADYNDDSCLPDARAPCSASGYPAYVMEAVQATDVQAAIRFARETGVRLIVKGTGHDVPGRSSGSDSLSIWTHGIRGITVNQSDSRAVASGAVASMKIAAGMRMGEIYAEAAMHNLTVVGGAENNVGIGGWITGGGHSPISSIYGLGADQVLEMEVVTADGEYRIINEHSFPDLFWAMRGGGGSTFAVLISVTVKAYPSFSGVQYYFAYNTTADSETFWSLVAFVHSQLPELSEAGVMGYYYGISNWTTDPNPAQQGKFVGEWIFSTQNSQRAMTLIRRLEKTIQDAKWGDAVVAGGLPIPFDDFTSTWLNSVGQETVGGESRLGSWLLDEEALTGDVQKLKTQLRKSSPQPWIFVGHLVAGPGVRNAEIPGGTNAVLPAWRRAYAHVVVPCSWPPLDATAKAAVTEDLRDIRVPALKALAPTSGAYVNEADPTNPDWQNDYWGEHYARLLSIKKRWDPQGVFWCRPCVGNELWEFVGGDGVGQDTKRICRK